MTRIAGSPRRPIGNRPALAACNFESERLRDAA